MSEKQHNVSFASLLCILFICLKLLDIIQWSWVWVLAPIWIPIPISILYYVSKSYNTVSKKEDKLA